MNEEQYKKLILKAVLCILISVLATIGVSRYQLEQRENRFIQNSMSYNLRSGVYDILMLRDSIAELYSLGSIEESYDRYDMKYIRDLNVLENTYREYLDVWEKSDDRMDWDVIEYIAVASSKISLKENYSEEDREYLAKSIAFLEFINKNYWELYDLHGSEQGMSRLYTDKIYVDLLNRINEKYNQTEISYLRYYDFNKGTDVDVEFNDYIPMKHRLETAKIIIERIFPTYNKSIIGNENGLYTFIMIDGEDTIEIDFDSGFNNHLKFNVSYDNPADEGSFSPEDLVTKGKYIINLIVDNDKYVADDYITDYKDEKQRVIDYVSMDFSNRRSTAYMRINSQGRLEKLEIKGLFDEPIELDTKRILDEKAIASKIRNGKIKSIDLKDRFEYEYRVIADICGVEYDIRLDPYTGKKLRMEEKRK